MIAPQPARPRGPSGELVLWVAAEAIPWASTGGLGDVVGTLPAVLRARGWDVRLCLPLHGRLINPLPALGPPVVVRELPRPGRFRVAVRPALDRPGGVPTYFVECPDLFDRPGVYAGDGESYGDNPFRFGVLQLAARALAESLERPAAILHCHDWHTALLPAVLQLPGERPARLADTRTILTIHNLQFQGESERQVLDDLGLPRALWHPSWAEHFGRANPLKAGILSADRVTTVSPTYANEIRTSERGMGLDGPLRERGADLRGILNGIDTTSADPAADPLLPSRYSADDLAGRARCKAALLRELGLPGTVHEPLCAFVGRITHDKGVDLFAEAAPEILGLGARAVVLGTGEKPLEAALQRREQQFPDRFRAIMRFDLRLARRIYAGVDVVVVPSRVEPCGLVQLYALRYGAVPVVHAVGGLRDTIRDGETGFFFHEPTAAALVAGVRRALEAHKDRALWSDLQGNGMRQDWSWTQSAAAYDALYREVLATPPLRRSPPPPPEPPAPPPPDWGPDLGASAGRLAMRLMVQGPRALYLYWDSSAQPPLELFLEERPTGLLFDVSRDRPPLGEAWLAAEPERAYRAFLRRPDGSVAAVSNAVLTPRDRPVGPDEATPAWLERALGAGLFAPEAAADRWEALFRDRPQTVRGARRFEGGVAQGVEPQDATSAFLYPPEGRFPR